MSAGCVDILWPRSTLKLASVDWVLGTKGRSCTDVCQERSLLCSESGLAGLTTETVWKRFETAVGKPCAQKKSSCTSGSNCEEWGAPYIHASHVSGPVKPECQFGTAPAVAPCRKVHTPRLRLTPLVHTIPPPYTHTTLHPHSTTATVAPCVPAFASPCMCRLRQLLGVPMLATSCRCRETLITDGYVPAQVRGYPHACMYAFMHVCIHTYIHTYIGRLVG